MISELKALIRDGEKIVRTASPATRQRNWRAWRKKASGFVDGLDGAHNLALELKPDVLVEDLRAMKDFLLRHEDNLEQTPPEPAEPAPTAQPAEEPEDDSSSFAVFISHRGQSDHDIASTMRDKLRLLSHTKVESIMYDKIKGGEDWYQWVEDNIAKSQILLLLYTDDEMDLRWCLYEAGLYRGDRSIANRHLICLKNANIANPPRPLQRFQSYNADEEGIAKFLTDFIYRGRFSDGEPLNRDMLDEDQEEYNKAVTDIAFLFRERQIQRSYFRKRLEIHLTDGDASAAAAPVNLAQAHIEAGELTRDLLNLPSSGDLKWQDVFEIIGNKGHRWVSEVEDAARAIEANRPLRQVLSSFDAASGRTCIPLLARVEQVRNRPKLMSVIFVESDALDRNGEDEDDDTRAPQPLVTIVHLLNMARRFRWNIVEHFIAKLSFAVPQGDALDALFSDIMTAITRIEAESERHGYLQLDSIAMSFPRVPRSVIEDLFTGFFADREKLTDAIAAKDVPAVIQALENMRTINKKFLIMAIEEYRHRISTIEPDDIKELSDILPVE